MAQKTKIDREAALKFWERALLAAAHGVVDDPIKLADRALVRFEELHTEYPASDDAKKGA